MTQKYFRRLLAHDQWANAAYARALEKNSPERSSALLAHIVGTEWTWLSRMQGFPAPVKVWPELSPAQCLEELPKLRERWESLFASTELGATYHYKNTKGEAFESSIADTLTHVFLHSHYHRGQIAQLLRQAGIDPPYTDFIEAARKGHLSF